MPLIKCRGIQMNATERVASRVTGAAFLIASGIVTLSSFMTWRWGGYACGHGPVFGVHQDLWQLGAPLRAWWRFVPPWLVAGGIVILALVGANELGLPIFRWLGPWRRALPLVGTAMIFVGAVGPDLPHVAYLLPMGRDVRSRQMDVCRGNIARRRRDVLCVRVAAPSSRQ
jgi:hypothetical protein